ncbi:MAG: cellulase family glycosylhydrolase [Bacteroidota bacterium]
MELFTYDKQLIAFKDSVEIIRKNNYANQSTSKYNLNYYVVLNLEDGQWKVIAIKLLDHDSIIEESRAHIPIQVEAVNGINYYPKDSPWLDFWKDFDEQIIFTDLQLLKSMGYNSLRIFIPSDGVVPGLEFQTMLNQLESLMDLAQSLDIKVIITLFDFPVSFQLDYYPRTLAQVEGVVHRIKEHSALLAYDIKNELDRDFELHGQSVVLNWLSFVISSIKELDNTHPVTIGWSKADHAHELESKVDFISFHDYNNLGVLQTNIERIKSYSIKPILLSEFGMSTYKGLFAPFGKSKTQQVSYVSEVRAICKEKQIGCMVWTLHDFQEIPSEVFGWKPWVKAKQKHFGVVE